MFGLQGASEIFQELLVILTSKIKQNISIQDIWGMVLYHHFDDTCLGNQTVDKCFFPFGIIFVSFYSKFKFESSCLSVLFWIPKSNTWDTLLARVRGNLWTLRCMLFWTQNSKIKRMCKYFWVLVIFTEDMLKTSLFLPPHFQNCLRKMFLDIGLKLSKKHLIL